MIHKGFRTNCFTVETKTKEKCKGKDNMNKRKRENEKQMQQTPQQPHCMRGVMSYLGAVGPDRVSLMTLHSTVMLSFPSLRHVLAFPFYHAQFHHKVPTLVGVS